MKSINIPLLINSSFFPFSQTELRVNFTLNKMKYEPWLRKSSINRLIEFMEWENTNNLKIGRARALSRKFHFRSLILKAIKVWTSIILRSTYKMRTTKIQLFSYKELIWFNKINARTYCQWQLLTLERKPISNTIITHKFKK